MVEKATHEEIILKIKEIMGREFSEEQLEIVKHYGKPLNAIAGAGSGKTTVSIGRILDLELFREVLPREILSITFSKKASLEIEERYLDSKNKLGLKNGTPLFKTFHAFFFSLIKNIPEYRFLQICSYNDEGFKFPLLKAVKGDGVRTDSEILEQYMRIRGVLVNYNISKDGLLSVKDRHLIEELKFDFDNYIEVNTVYNNLKLTSGKLDFDDMQTVLLDYLETNPNADTLKLGFHNSFKHIILDEYQDVSPIQVKLMDILMSEKQIRNLMVTGDDDQCIYSFRGSQSEYIINFLERYKNARRKYISKNYRCKSEILNEVIPMISQNKIRVEKDLVANNQGGRVKYYNTDDSEQFSKYKNMLLEDIDNMEAKDVAVLVRYNKHRTLLADRLAEEGVPIDITNARYLLQNDTVYKVLFEIAKAIKSDNPNLLRPHLNKCFKNIKPYTLDLYNNPEESFVYDILNGHIKTNKETRDSVQAIRDSQNAYVVISNVWLIVRDFYTFMVKKKRINLKDLNSIVSYVIELTLSDGEPTVSWESLINAENYKKAYLTDFIGDDNVFKVFTIHSVKGLEFKKVYLFGLDSDIVSHDDMRDYKNKQNSKTKGVFEQDEAYQKNKISEALSATGSNVEEERRIFYVACTRAIDELVIGYSGNHLFQLLKEMKSFNKHRKKLLPNTVPLEEKRA